MATSRTIGPLHFEDLDPKRFEDLIRQLAYEFKLSPDETLHGLVFAAACDFSKASRDGFARKCRDIGVSEWHLRARLAMKRKAHRMLKDRVGASLLLRSPDATNYPHVDDPAVFKKNPSWVV